MEGRHEIKHYISLSDYYELSTRLRTVLYPDPHAGETGKYFIRSLYFDDAQDTALQEKLDGVKNRDKYRIRYYNLDTGFIRLEKKSKRNSLCQKVSAPLTEEECRKIVNGDYVWMRDSSNALIQELYRKMQNGMKPKTIVDYIRDPFIYPAGNVRVTLDHDIRTGLRCTDFLDPDVPTIPVVENPIILEVKWDNFFPDIVRDAVQVSCRRSSAFSKYAACRAYDF